MRGNGRQHPPITVSAILVSTALLTGVIAIPVLAHGHGRMSDQAGPPVETAFAIPRNGFLAGQDNVRPAPNRTGEIGITRPLSAPDAALVRQIFALQQSARIDQAIQLTRRLQDDTLLADILADRYLAQAARPDLSSLQQWLRRWPDRPDAGAIRHLVSDLSRGRATASTPAPTPGPVQDADQPEEADPADQAFERNPLLDRTVQTRLAQGSEGARSALRLLTATRHIDPLYAASLRAEVARSLFTTGDDSLALSTARAALSQSDGQIGLAGYVAGLVAWRQNRTALAAGFFEQASRAALTAASTRAGAAFWAARAHRRLQDETAWRAWMERAAASSHTFYGMLAARMLDQTASPVVAPVVAVADRTDADRMAPAAGVLGEIDVEAVDATAEGHRAFALLQVGQTKRAEATLRQLWPRVRDDAALCRSIALVAQEAGMTGLSGQITATLQRQDDQPGNAAHFPMPRLQPRSGFTVNPALVYALTRLESNFDNKAVSGAGAHGLMQIMPTTASFVLSRNGDQSRRPATNARALHNPAFNLEIGQRYLTYLSAEDGIHGDLIRLLASYNAGPNAVAQWGLSQPAPNKDASDPEAVEGDPLLFMEALPVSETRNFVHRALTYLWIYAARMDLPAPSLDTLAQDEWPRFDDEQRMAGAGPGVIARAPEFGSR